MGKSQKLGNMPNAPAFSAYRSSSNQSVTTSTWTKVQCQTEEFDTASAYDNATNYRFTPQVAGYYQVNAQLCPVGVPVTRGIAAIYKNGSSHKIGSDYLVDSTTTGRSVVSTLVYMNGTTDYLEMFGYVTSVSGPGFGYATGADTYFQATLVRPA